MQIVTYPHPTLRHLSKPVKRVDAELRATIRQMFDLMYQAKGVGLAANQVDLPLRLFIVNLQASPTEGEELVFINPVISRPRGSEEAEEGCLSFPGLYGQVRRPRQVRVHAFNLAGQEICADLDGLLSRVVQHESDHLDGVLFTDRMSEAALLALKPSLDAMEAEYQNALRVGESSGDGRVAAHLREWEERYC